MTIFTEVLPRQEHVWVNHYASSEDGTLPHDIVSVVVGDIEYLFDKHGIVRIFSDCSTSVSQSMENDRNSNSNVPTAEQDSSHHHHSLAHDVPRRDLSSVEPLSATLSELQLTEQQINRIANISGFVAAELVPSHVSREVKNLVQRGIPECGRFSGRISSSPNTEGRRVETKAEVIRTSANLSGLAIPAVIPGGSGRALGEGVTRFVPVAADALCEMIPSSDTLSAPIARSGVKISNVASNASASAYPSVASSGLLIMGGTTPAVPVNDFLIVNIADIIGEDRARTLRGKLKDLKSRRGKITPTSQSHQSSTAFDFESIEELLDTMGRSTFKHYDEKSRHCHHFVREFLAHLTSEDFEVPTAPTNSSYCSIL